MSASQIIFIKYIDLSKINNIIWFIIFICYIFIYLIILYIYNILFIIYKLVVACFSLVIWSSGPELKIRIILSPEICLSLATLNNKKLLYWKILWKLWFNSSEIIMIIHITIYRKGPYYRGLSIRDFSADLEAGS